jgi:hypothetical protein
LIGDDFRQLFPVPDNPEDILLKNVHKNYYVAILKILKLKESMSVELSEKTSQADSAL